MMIGALIRLHGWWRTDPRDCPRTADALDALDRVDDLVDRIDHAATRILAALDERDTDGRHD